VTGTGIFARRSMVRVRATIAKSMVEATIANGGGSTTDRQSKLN
jgi:hypothetical protein